MSITYDHIKRYIVGHDTISLGYRTPWYATQDFPDRRPLKFGYAYWVIVPYDEVIHFELNVHNIIKTGY